jgi:hypothetical protein
MTLSPEFRNSSGELTRLPDFTIAKGVHQANTLYSRFGFFQHYLAVITAMGASDQYDSNIPCRGLRSHTIDPFEEPRTFTLIVDFPSAMTSNLKSGPFSWKWCNLLALFLSGAPTSKFASNIPRKLVSRQARSPIAWRHLWGRSPP